MIGRRLSHYRVVEKVGAGGMGDVYRAHDERLDRDVAIKVLPKGMLADERARKRFRKEALALSKLNHPHIATVFDFDTEEGVAFLVMEFVEGATLGEKLKTGALPEKEVTELGAQVADALEEAHERGVVHRDLKPGNIGVTPKGRVKVLDFGLAKWAPPLSDTATTEAMTDREAMVGTLPYMAPEHLRGAGGDHRSDLYSFGVVLFEMATGRRPFEEKLSTALSGAILHEAPPSPRSVNRHVSPGLEALILKALEKDPERRYQSAREMRVDLGRLSAPAPLVARKRKPGLAARWPWVVGGLAAVLALTALLNVGGWRGRLLGGGSPVPIDSLAVLPLANLSGDPAQEYLADGMTDALISKLGAITALRVISRTSVMRYKEAPKAVSEIAGELGVDAVVEGSVQRSGERVQVSARLIHASTETQLWTETYQRDFVDILSLQNEVASAIAQEIRIELRPGERERLAVAKPAHSEAYDAYLLGLYHWRQPYPESVPKAIEYFNTATELDPSFAPAFAGLADAYRELGTYFILPPQEAFAQSKSAALKALELDPTLAEAHASLGFTSAHGEWDWSGAEASFQRAIELNDDYAFAHEAYGSFLVYMGRSEEGLRELRTAVELDPLGLWSKMSLGAGLYYARRYEDSIREYRKVLEMNPNLPNARLLLSLNYLAKSMHEEAIAEAEVAAELAGRLPLFLGILGCSYALAGERAEALAILDELKELQKRMYVDSAVVVFIYAGLGEWDDALAWAERSYEERSDGWLYAKVAPFLDPLRGQPRFQELIRRMNFPD